MLLLLTALCVLPVYALTTAAGSHSAASVIKHCLKSGVKPAVARWAQPATGMCGVCAAACASTRAATFLFSLRLRRASPLRLRRALQRLSMQRPVAAAGEVEAAEQPGGDAGEDEPASAAPQLPHQASWLGPLPLSPLQHTPGFGMPPLLARHSAPLPHLRRLSAGPPIQEASSGELEVSPFAAAAAEGLDPAAVAAAAAAAAMGPEVEVDDDERHGHQRSLTRLMGAPWGRSGWGSHDGILSAGRPFLAGPGRLEQVLAPLPSLCVPIPTHPPSLTLLQAPCTSASCSATWSEPPPSVALAAAAA